MLQLSVVHLDTRKILIFNLYIIHDSFEKILWQDVLNFTTYNKRPTD